MNISNAQAAALSPSLTLPKPAYARALDPAPEPGPTDRQKFSEAVSSMESAAESKNRAPPDTRDSRRTKKNPESDGIAAVAPIVQNANQSPAAPEDPGTAPTSAGDCNKSAGAASAGSARSPIAASAIPAPEIEIGAAADPLPAEAEAVIPKKIGPAKSGDVHAPPSQNAAPASNVHDISTASANMHAVDADSHSTDPDAGISRQVSSTPSGARAIGVDTISQPGDIRDASAISSPLPSSDMNTLADAFESSVRNFEQSGQHWTGRASFTLQSSVLQGASFQVTSDGRSLCIQLTQMAAAAVPISRREENELGSILTRKLGREVNVDLGLSEIAASEESEQAESNDD